MISEFSFDLIRFNYSETHANHCRGALVPYKGTLLAIAGKSNIYDDQTDTVSGNIMVDAKVEQWISANETWQFHKSATVPSPNGPLKNWIRFSALAKENKIYIFGIFSGKIAQNLFKYPYRWN